MDDLNKILAARESRAVLRKQICDQDHHSLSLCLNVPGYPKSDQILQQFFLHVLKELKRWLKANRVFINEENEINLTDEAGDFYLTSITGKSSDIYEVKKIGEGFEESHELGRFIDIDIIASPGNTITSGKEKKCFFCEEFPAIVCMREKRHTYAELRTFMNNKINSYFEDLRKEDVCRSLSAIALKSILYEINLSPKPGLVDKLSSGSHNDMDHYTFLESTSVLSPYFIELSKAGFYFEMNELTKALPIIRNTGLKMEADMFLATSRVNTQKGTIFLMGLSMFAAAYLIKRDKSFHIEKFRGIIQSICKNLVHNELTNPADQIPTHGEVSFRTYDSGGVRAEAESGFRTVMEKGLPELRKGVLKDPETQIRTLLALMSETDDTTILYRSDARTLAIVKEKAKACLKNFNWPEYQDLIDFCNKERISPGGSADLFAVCLFVYFTERKFMEIE